jgi:hypothetical protein
MRYAKLDLMDQIKAIAEFGASIGSPGANCKGHCHCDYCSKCVPAVFSGGSVIETFGEGAFVCKACCDEQGVVIPGSLTNAIVIESNRNEIYERVQAERKQKSLQSLKGLLESRGKKVTGKLAAI